MKSSHEMTVSVLEKRGRILRRRRILIASAGALAGTAVAAAALVVMLNVNRPQGVDLVAPGSVTDTSLNEIVSSAAEGTGDAGPQENDETEYNFVPVLTEDEIEYMGIPYKDLTADQFIQLWAQCTRECNVQRLYVITYDNNSYTDENGEPIEDTRSLSEQFCRENAQQLLVWAGRGIMPYRFADVELVELEDAPAGYYSNDNGEELHYAITYRNIGSYYDYGAADSGVTTSWITLKKINGYWKMGIMMSSSPYFFDPQQSTGYTLETAGLKNYVYADIPDVSPEERGIEAVGAENILLDTKQAGEYSVFLVGDHVTTDDSGHPGMINCFKFGVELYDGSTAGKLAGGAFDLGQGGYWIYTDRLSDYTDVFQFGDNYIVVLRYYDSDGSCRAVFHAIKDGVLYPMLMGDYSAVTGVQIGTTTWLSENLSSDQGSCTITDADNKISYSFDFDAIGDTFTDPHYTVKYTDQ